MPWSSPVRTSLRKNRSDVANFAGVMRYESCKHPMVRLMVWSLASFATFGAGPIEEEPPSELAQDTRGNKYGCRNTARLALLRSCFEEVEEWSSHILHSDKLAIRMDSREARKGDWESLELRYPNVRGTKV
eukprot:6471427-Amphidinium_carterae.1